MNSIILKTYDRKFETERYCLFISGVLLKKKKKIKTI